MTPVLLLLGLLLGLLAGTAALVATRVRRLHRLHQRLDAARAALDDALARRAAAALGAATALGAAPPVPGPVDRSAVAPLTVSAAGVDPAAVTAPVAAADRSAVAPLCGPGAVVDLAAAARAAGRPGPWDAAREDAENALGRALGRLDRSALPAPVAAELADAERLVVLGRAVHNDAVRDALALRTRRLVRLLRLAGTAPVPAYVEFAADPPPP